MLVLRKYLQTLRLGVWLAAGSLPITGHASAQPAEGVVTCAFTNRCDKESQTCAPVNEAARYDPAAGLFDFLGVSAVVAVVGEDQGDLTITAEYETGDFVGVLSTTAPAGMSNFRQSPPEGEPAMYYYFGTCQETNE